MRVRSVVGRVVLVLFAGCDDGGGSSDPRVGDGDVADGVYFLSTGEVRVDCGGPCDVRP